MPAVTVPLLGELRFVTMLVAIVRNDHAGGKFMWLGNVRRRFEISGAVTKSESLALVADANRLNPHLVG
jgi:hypothetical protein